MAKIGFIGVGMMGYGMALNLMRAGHQLSIRGHRNRRPIDDLVARGATEAADLAELLRGRDAIFLCLSTSQQVAETIADMLPVLGSGQIVIDTGTSDPDLTVRLAADVCATGAVLVDAPVGGGPKHAAEGRLASLVGGTEADFARVRPLLEATSAVIEHIGPVGSGHRAKLLNNWVAVGQAALVIEAYRAAQRDGIAWDKLYRIMQGGAARSGSLDNLIGQALAGNQAGYSFSADNAAKDFSYLCTYLERLGADPAIPRVLAAYFEGEAQAHGGATLLSELLPAPQQTQEHEEL